MSESSSSSSGGIGFAGLLTLLFIALKLTGFIAWSWMWVLAPLWVGAAAVVAILAAMLLGSVVILLGAGAVSLVLAALDRKYPRTVKRRFGNLEITEKKPRRFL